MNSDPLVTVVIAAFNAGPFIEHTLQSVLDQDYTHFEILVIDNCSTDDTAARVLEMSGRDPRIRLIRRIENSGGPAAPRNQGIREARGELVAFLDADDLWTKWKLADQVSAITAHPDLALVYSMFWSIGDAGLLDIRYGVKPLPFRPALSRATLERENTVTLSSAFTRLSLLKEAGGFDEDPRLRAVEDYDLWLRLSSRGPIGLIPRIHGFYRVHQSAISRSTDNAALVRHLFAKRGVATTQRAPARCGVFRKLVRLAIHQLSFLAVRVIEAISRAVAPSSILVFREGWFGRSNES